MIQSRRGKLRRVALSSALVVGVITSATAFSTQALAAGTHLTTTTKVTTFTLNCNTGIANGTVSVKTTQIYTTPVAPGTVFTLKWKSVTTVSGALASAAYAIAPNGTEKGTITLDEDLVTHATGTYQGNEAGEWNISPPTNQLTEQGTISSPSSFNVLTPATGYYFTPNFTAGSTAATAVFKAEDDNATINIYNSSGQLVTTTNANCTPAGTPAVIAKITIS